VGELALTLVLLAAMGLLLQDFAGQRQVELGYNPRNLLAVQLWLPEPKYPDETQQAAFAQQLVDRVGALPGVRSAACQVGDPLGTSAVSGLSGPFQAEGAPVNANGTPLVVALRPVTAEYMQACQIRIIKGRGLTSDDVAQSADVALVSERLAARVWPGMDPLGQRVKTAGGTYGVIGVVADTAHYGRTHEVEQRGVAYLPLTRVPGRDLSLLVRTDGSPMALAGAVREHVRALDPDQPVASVRPMDAVADDAVALPRFYVVLVSLFAAAAAILASIGMYGVMSYLVSQRTHEIGIRVALGAQEWDILRMVLGRGLALVAAGTALGWAAIFGLNSYLSSVLVKMKPMDPPTLAAASVFLAAIALVACYVPAARAARISPAAALRQE
jgi:putative ABC transport system permease protein